MPTTTGTTMIGDHEKVICSLDQSRQHETDEDRSVAVSVPVPVPVHDDCDDAVVKDQNQQPDRDLSALMSRVALPKEQIQQDTMNECSTTSTTAAAPTTTTARLSIDGFVGNTADPPSSPPSPPSRMSRRRRRQQQQRPAVATKNEIPLDETYLQSLVLQSGLPVSAYDLEITKTLRRCWQLQAQHVALQMPEGLLMYATVLVDVLVQGYAHMVNNAWLQQHQQPQQQQPAHEPSADSTPLSNPYPPAPRQQQFRVSILADVTYGACCIDDLGAQAIGADLLVHYGHSCLVPLQHTVVPCLYVFVEIQIDTAHLVDCLMVSLVDDKKDDGTPTNDAGSNNNNTKNNSKRQDLPYIYLLGTVQFRHALVQALELLRDKYQYPAHLISIPQVKPLSPGEVLGCTSPILTQHYRDHDVDQSTNNHNHHHLSAIVCFVADGRFHLESTMIANHNTIDTFYRYDPYHKRLTVERYDFDRMHQLRFDAIQHVMRMNTCLTPPPSSMPVTFGILMGTLGRQGNPALVQRIQTILRQHGKKSIIILLSELSPTKLQRLNARHRIMAWVQIACPRLSIDWGHAFVTTSDGYNSNNNDNNNNNNMSSMVVPVLTPYELMVSLGEAIWHNHHYPMDYYATDGGPWSNYHDQNRHRQWQQQQQQQQQRVVSSSTSTTTTSETMTTMT